MTKAVSAPKEPQGSIDPQDLQRAFDKYFARSDEEIIDGLAERAPELLVHLAEQAEKKEN